MTSLVGLAPWSRDRGNKRGVIGRSGVAGYQWGGPDTGARGRSSTATEKSVGFVTAVICNLLLQRTGAAHRGKQWDDKQASLPYWKLGQKLVIRHGYLTGH